MDIKTIIQDNLKEGQVLKNWTPKKQYFGDDIIITKIDNSGVSFNAPNFKKKSVTKGTVSYNAIEQVYSFWDKIRSGEISRTQYTNEGIKSHSTRYILDILKELDNQGVI